MHLITVIPIVHIPGKFGGGHFTYFSAKTGIKRGSLVEVNFQRRKVPALVLEVEELGRQKTEIKNAAFRLKRISRVLAGSFLTEYFFAAARYAANYYVSPFGNVLKQFIPAEMLKSGIVPAETAVRNKSSHYHQIFIQAPRAERLKYYKSGVRESFAKNESVFLCAPTISEAEDIYSELKQGLEARTFLLHGELARRQFQNTCELAIVSAQPVLIVGTTSCLAIPRPDAGTFIMEHESSSVYKKRKSPFVDSRVLLEGLARIANAKLIMGDTVLSLEAYWRKIKDNNSFVTPPTELSENAKTVIFNNSGFARDSKEKNFTALPDELNVKIKEFLARGENTTLFINRKGLYPFTVCRDCSKILACERCSSPLVTHKGTSNKSELVCHKCFARIPVAEKCPHCGSWNLRSYGLGTERVIAELEARHPEAKIFRLDGDVIKNKKQGEALRDDFLNSRGGILVATELFFSFFKKPVDNIIVVSLDNLFTMPDFRMSERIFRLLIKLKNMAGNFFGVQTRLPDQTIFKHALSNNIVGFLREELESRRAFNFPPYSLLIKINFVHKDRKMLTGRIAELRKNLESLGYDPLDFSPRAIKIGNIYGGNILLRLSPESWPDEHGKLADALRELGAGWTVEIDPDNIF